MEKKQERVAIAVNAMNPLDNREELSKEKHEAWTKYCLEKIEEVKKAFVEGKYNSNDKKGLFLTTNQQKAYEECHRMWLKPGYDVDERILASFQYFIDVLKGSNSKTFNSYEAERIIKLCDYLLFQYKKALGRMESPEIIGSVNALLEKGAIVQKEADIYSAKARKEQENQGIRIIINEDTRSAAAKEEANRHKATIKDILLRQGKDVDAIDSLLLLCDDPYVAEMIANDVAMNNYVSVYQIIQYAKELRGDFKKVA